MLGSKRGMKQIKSNIQNSRAFQRTFARLQRTRIYSSRIPLLKVLEIFYLKITDENAHQQASAIAFSFTLSLFPALLFLFSLLPFISSALPIPDPTSEIMSLLESAFPRGIYIHVETTIRDLLDTRRLDLLSFGFLFAIYAATSGVVELMNSLNSNYAYSEKRSYIKKRLVAIGLAFLFAFLLLFAVLVNIVGEIVLIRLQDTQYFTSFMKMVVGESSVNYLVEHELLTQLMRYVVSFAVFYLGISLVYYVAPAVSKTWRFFALGSAIASVMAILSTNLFSYYLSNFANYNKLYGSIGTFIALLIWLYLLAWILLLGFSINASIWEAKLAHEKELEDRMDMLEGVEDDD